MYKFSEKSQKKKKEIRIQQPKIQRRIVVNHEELQPNIHLLQPAIINLLQNGNKIPVFIRLLDHFVNDSEQRQFQSWGRFARFMVNKVNSASKAETLDHGQNAARWFQNPNTQGVIEINPNDPTFIAISHAVMQNLRDRPYETDAKHEVVPSSPNPNIRITRIQMIKNPTQLRQYAAARADIATRTTQLGRSLNEAHLFSGFREAIADQIARKGHRPDMGAYEEGLLLGKGHGALGRGAYFTDTVGKAVSYARGPNQGDQPQVRQNPGDGTEHSFFLQDVLLGNVLYGNGFPFRHSHHNEMVRMQRGNQAAPNLMRAEGRSTGNVNGQNMRNFDSIVSAKTHEPGGRWMNILDRAINGSFDSNEYLIRNADQVYVKYRIYYTLELAPQQGPYLPGIPLTSIENIQVQRGAVHLPRNWRWQQQQTIGTPHIV